MADIKVPVHERHTQEAERLVKVAAPNGLSPKLYAIAVVAQSLAEAEQRGYDRRSRELAKEAKVDGAEA